MEVFRNLSNERSLELIMIKTESAIIGDETSLQILQTSEADFKSLIFNFLKISQSICNYNII